MKDTSHRGSHVLVVAIDGPWVLPSACWSDFLRGREQRFDGFVAEHEQGSDRSQTGRQRFVATRRTDPADDLFAAEFLQIVRCLAWTVSG